MFGSTVLEIGIGMAFVYLMVSLTVTAANELLAAALSSRAKNLWEGMQNLLNDAKDNLAKGDGKNGDGSALAQKLYNHPLVQRLSKPGQKPSYIPSRTFALALLDVIADPTRDIKKQVEILVAALPEEQKAKLQQGMKKVSNTGLAASELKKEMLEALSPLPDSSQKKELQGLINRIPTSLKELIDLSSSEDIKRTLNVLLEEAGHDIESLKESIEIWFNNSMERVSGWYKRKSQYIQVALALIITFWANIDTVLITRSLSNDGALRSALVAQASKEPAPAPGAKETPGELKAEAENFNASLQRINSLALPVGWTNEESNDYRKWPGWHPASGTTISQWANLWGSTIRNHFFGWMLTAAAASLGAPFWFDLLNKFINIRSSGKSPEEKPKKPKQVPQPMGPGETADEQREKIDRAITK
jgi:hypothetical protein